MSTTANFDPASRKASASLGQKEGVLIVGGLAAIILYALWQTNKVVNSGTSLINSGTSLLNGAAATTGAIVNGATATVGNVTDPTSKGLGSSGGIIAAAPGNIVGGAGQLYNNAIGEAGAAYNGAKDYLGGLLGMRPQAPQVNAAQKAQDAIAFAKKNDDYTTSQIARYQRGQVTIGF